MLKKQLENEGEVVGYRIMQFSSHKSMLKAIFPYIVGFGRFPQKLDSTYILLTSSVQFCWKIY
jgi:hypothetical protein